MSRQKHCDAGSEGVVDAELHVGAGDHRVGGGASHFSRLPKRSHSSIPHLGFSSSRVDRTSHGTSPLFELQGWICVEVGTA